MQVLIFKLAHSRVIFFPDVKLRFEKVKFWPFNNVGFLSETGEKGNIRSIKCVAHKKERFRILRIFLKRDFNVHTKKRRSK